MEIIYMNNLISWKNKYKRGLPIEEIDIIKLQESNNLLFPKSYSEFLTLSGKYCAAVKLGGHRFEYASENQSIAKKLLKDFKLSHLIKKPFWVIATSDNAFYYFHLDEGDNPPVYILDCDYYEEYPDEYSFGKIADTFQAWIEKWIEYYESDPENQ